MKSNINSVFGVLTMMFLLIHCTPSNPTTTSTNMPQPKMQFKANGFLINCDAIWSSNLGWVKYPQILKNLYSMSTSTSNGTTTTILSSHELNGDDGTGNNYIFLPFLKNQQSLIGTYTHTTGSDCHINGILYSRGYHIITVSSISNNSASGTFSGMIKAYYDTTNIVYLTEGTFENIPFTN